MKIVALLACLGFLVGTASMSHAEFTKSGPPPISQDFYGGGGGGP